VFQVFPAQKLSQLEGMISFSKTKSCQAKVFTAYMYLCFLKLKNRRFISLNKSTCSTPAMRSDLSLLSSLVTPAGSLEACNFKSEFVLKTLQTIVEE